MEGVTVIKVCCELFTGQTSQLPIREKLPTLPELLFGFENHLGENL